jgi:REP element-mobilizing transposase RayT
LTTTEPIYTPETVSPALQLNWGLTIFWRQTPIPDNAWLTQLQADTEPDGVRVLRHRVCSNDASQFFISTQPHVSPAQMIRSVKGRLQHLIRERQPKAFQRNYAIRSIGSATRSVVEEYVGKQLDRHSMADSRVQNMLHDYQRVHPAVDLSLPVLTAHGKCWYGLHLVFVNEQRWSEIRREVLDSRMQMIQRVAEKHGHRMSRVALLADHVHVTLGCAVDQRPAEIALSYLNNLAYAAGMKPVFQLSYYVGTIGEYDRGVV